jgi:Sulfotransferase family
MNGGVAGPPVFLLGIQRGGTNQVLNILRSHPATCWPEGEFHEVFRGRVAPGLGSLRREGALRMARKWGGYLPILLASGDILDPDREPRARLDGRRGRAAARGLAASASANRASVARYKAALVERGFIDAGIAPDRMTVKLVNYNLAFAEDLAALYPGARFVGLIRDGRAVCEGFTARGGGVEAAASAWDFVGRRLIELEAAGLSLRTWRFEDLVADPGRVAGEIYRFAGLDPAAVRGICLQDKPRRSAGAAGGFAGIDKRDGFYSLAEIGRHMRADANQGALARLPAAARAAVTERCGPVLGHFGYV